MVLVDSDVWSEAFRKKGTESEYVGHLRKLIENDEVIMIGPIRQEVLSGIKERKQFDRIKNLLKPFSSEQIDDRIFELAASFFNICRSKGIQGSHTDFLICACSATWKVKILSKDRDYEQYAKHVPVKTVRELG